MMGWRAHRVPLTVGPRLVAHLARGMANAHRGDSCRP